VDVKVEPTLKLNSFAKAKASYGGSITLKNGKVKKVEATVGGELKIGTLLGVKIGGSATAGVSVE
jgi:hypothetical protein